MSSPGERADIKLMAWISGVSSTSKVASFNEEPDSSQPGAMPWLTAPAVAAPAPPALAAGTAPSPSWRDLMAMEAQVKTAAAPAVAANQGNAQSDRIPATPVGPVASTPKTETPAAPPISQAKSQAQANAERPDGQQPTSTAAQLARALYSSLHGGDKAKAKAKTEDPSVISAADLAEAEKIQKMLGISGVQDPSVVSTSSIVYQAARSKLAVDTGSDGDVSAYLRRPDTHPAALATMLDGKYDAVWRGWDLETIQQTLKLDYGCDVPDGTMNKIASLKIILSEPEKFFSDWFTFEKTCLSLNDQAPMMQIIEDVSPEQMSFAVSAVRALGIDEPWSAELEAYTAARLFDHGYVVAPTELAFAQPVLSTRLAPEQAALAKSASELYQATLAGTEPADLDMESPVAIQAGRLLRVHAYCLDRVGDLVNQVS